MQFRKLLTMMLFIILFTSIIQLSFTTVVAQNTDEDKSDDDKKDEDKTKDEDSEDKEKDEDGDGVGDETESAYEREVQVEVEAKQIKIESKLKNGENKDKISFEFKVEEEPEFKLKYETESNDTESEMKFKVKFFALIEYAENGTTTGYQKGEEISTYKLDKQEFNDITHVTEGVDPDITHVFTAITADGVFKIIIKLTGSIKKDAGVLLTPNSLKIDIEINNFPYNATGSSLALVSRLKTEYEMEKQEDTPEEQAGLTNSEEGVNFGTSGFFSWAENATADGTVVPVVTSSIQQLDKDDEGETDLEEGEKVEKLTFSFIAKDAANIYWDPRVGVTSVGTQAALAALNSSGIPGFEFLYAFIAIFSLVGFSIFRKRKY